MIEMTIAIFVMVGMIIGALNYLAKASDLQMVAMRLDQKIVTDQIMQVQQRIWQLNDRNKGYPCTQWSDEKERTDYRKLNEDLEVLKKRRDILIEQNIWK